MSVAALIEEAKQVYAATGLDCGNAHLPPADPASVDAIGAAQRGA